MWTSACTFAWLMPVDLSSRSHIDTPAWQSFEMRMRLRAAARRQAKRRRRRRRLQYAAAGACALALGVASARALQRTDGVVIDWPVPPAAPAAPRPIVVGSLPLPPNWNAPLEQEKAEISSDATPVEAPAMKPAVSPLSAERRALETRVVPTPSAMEEAAPPPRSVSTSGSLSPESAPAVATNTGQPAPAPASLPPLDTVRPADPPPAARSTPAPVVTAPTVDPREPVRGAIEQYRSAYERLDASAARTVWPAVDAGALARAFGSLASQELRFEGCTIDVSGANADATCTGHSRVVPKIGGGSETARRTWRFKLRQAGRDWVIEKATAK